MQSSRTIMDTIRSNLKAGAGDDCFVSQMVIRTERDKPYLSIFASQRQPESGKNTFGRPTIYCLCDIETGAILSVYQCAKRDFTNASYKERYQVEDRPGMTEDDYDRLYAQLDRTRQTILETDEPKIFRPLYETYMDMLVELVSPAYARFYKDLSILPEHGMKQAAKEEPGQQEKQAEPSGIAETPTVDRAEPEQETKMYEASDVNWTPAVNLSTLPERSYRVIEKVADVIRFLPTDQPNQIRYEYPLFCFRTDTKQDIDIWQELLVRISDKNTKFGHYRTSPKRTIYSTCRNGKAHGCMFLQCPYIVAAYVKYLKENNPERLKEERAHYMENRFLYDKKYSNGINYQIEVPGSYDKAKLGQGLALSDNSTTAVVRNEDGTFTLSWLEKTDTDEIQIQKRVLKAEEFAYKDTWELTDASGNKIPEHIAYAVLADYFDRSGWEEQEARTRQAAESPIKNVSRQAKAKSTVTEKPETNKNTVSEKPVQRTQENRQKIAETLLMYTPRNGNAYRCLTTPGIRQFYGVVLTKDPQNSPAIQALFAMLKTKGFTETIFCTADEFAEMQAPLKRNALYCVSDISGTSEGLDKFFPGTAIVLCGEKQELDTILSEPMALSIYGRCSLRDIVPGKENMSPERIAARFTSGLPDTLKAQLTNGWQEKFFEWRKKCQEQNDRELSPEYLAWRCFVENALLFTDERG